MSRSKGAILLWATALTAFMLSSGTLASTSIQHGFCSHPTWFVSEINTIGRTSDYEVLLITQSMRLYKVATFHRGDVFAFDWTGANTQSLDIVYPALADDADFAIIKQTGHLGHSLVRTSSDSGNKTSLFFVTWVDIPNATFGVLAFNPKTSTVYHQEWNYSAVSWLLDKDVIWISDEDTGFLTITQIQPYSYEYRWVVFEDGATYSNETVNGGYLLGAISPLRLMCYGRKGAHVIFSQTSCKGRWPERLLRGFTNDGWVYLLGEMNVYVFDRNHLPSENATSKGYHAVELYRIDYETFLNCTGEEKWSAHVGTITGIVALLLAVIAIQMIYWFNYKPKREGEDAHITATAEPAKLSPKNGNDKLMAPSPSGLKLPLQKSSTTASNPKKVHLVKNEAKDVFHSHSGPTMVPKESMGIP